MQDTNTNYHKSHELAKWFSKLDTSLNWFVCVCDHVARKYHVEKTEPNALTPMCIHCSLQTNNFRVYSRQQ